MTGFLITLFTCFSTVLKITKIKKNSFFKTSTLNKHICIHVISVLSLLWYFKITRFAQKNNNVTGSCIKHHEPRKVKSCQQRRDFHTKTSKTRHKNKQNGELYCDHSYRVCVDYYRGYHCILLTAELATFPE